MTFWAPTPLAPGDPAHVSHLPHQRSNSHQGGKSIASTLTIEVHPRQQDHENTRDQHTDGSSLRHAAPPPLVIHLTIAIRAHRTSDLAASGDDEPTGALDPRNTSIVIRGLRDLTRTGTSVIIVTHDPDVAHHADRIVTLQSPA